MTIETAPGRSWADDPSLSPELRALLACARAVIDSRQPAELRMVLAACTDVEHLCKAAIDHGMLGHLHRLVAADQATLESRQAVFESVLVNRLTELQRLSAQRNLRQTGHLLRILESLEAAGVSAMPIKGPAWGQRLYGDVTLRSWSDLDLIVAHGQALTARETLLASGFADSSPFNATILTRQRGGLGQVALSAIDQSVHLELHWEVTVGPGGQALRAETLLARAGRLQLLDRSVLSPSAVDCLLITCLNGAKDRWSSVEGLLGLAVQLSNVTPVTWQEVVTTARNAGCARRVVVGVAHVCRVFGLASPTEVAEALGHDAMARALSRSLTPSSLRRGTPTGSRNELEMKFWRFATEDSLTAGLRHGAVRFFRPGPEDWEGFALSPRMAWLHYLVRPFRLAIKWVKRPF